MIYRVGNTTPDSAHWGYEFFSTKRAAEARSRAIHKENREDFDERVAAWKLETDVESEEEYAPPYVLLEACKTPKTKAAILRLLRWWASHPDNG